MRALTWDGITLPHPRIVLTYLLAANVAAQEVTSIDGPACVLYTLRVVALYMCRALTVNHRVICWQWSGCAGCRPCETIP